MKIFNIIFLTFTSILFFSLTANGQTGIKGKVIDEETGEAIMFSTVSVFKNEILVTGTEADFEGQFLFENLQAGAYNIEVWFLGFEKKKIENVTVVEGKTTELNITMIETDGLNCWPSVWVVYPPLIDLHNTTSGQIITFDKTKR